MFSAIYVDRVVGEFQAPFEPAGSAEGFDHVLMSDPGNPLWFHSVEAEVCAFDPEGTLVHCLEDSKRLFQPFGVPDAPTGLAVTRVGLTSVDLAWDPGQTPWLDYAVYRDGWSEGIGGQPTRTVTGLEPGTEYTFQVTAFYGAGDEEPQGPESLPSESVTVTTALPDDDGELEPVSDLRVVSVGTTGVGLRWSEPPWLNDVRVLRDGVEVAVLDGGSVAYSEIGLEPGTEYTYTVIAVPEGNQTATGATVTATTNGDPVTCTANMEVLSDWGSAFYAIVTVTNTGEAAAGGWAASWDWPGEHQVVQHWNADLTQTGGTVEAHDVGWNGALESGGSTTFGVIAEPGGQEALPTSLDCSLAS